MSRLLGFLALFFFSLAQAGPAVAANAGAAFLRIDTGARPAAMGGAYAAIADDVNALYYNPGGLSRLAKKELGATHAEWLLGSRFDFIAYAHPAPYGTFGLGLTRLSSGGLEGRDGRRRAAGGFAAADTAFTLGFGRTARGLLPTGATSLGGSVKYLESRIGSDSASTLALDLGAVHQLRNRPLSLGLSVLNMGRGLRFLDQADPLPLTISLGSAYRFAGVLNLALDIRHEPYDDRLELGIGTEYALFRAFFLRAGYASLAPAGAGGTPLNGLGAGFGIRVTNYRVDYTFTPFGALGNAQRFSLGASF